MTLNREETGRGGASSQIFALAVPLVPALASHEKIRSKEPAKRAKIAVVAASLEIIGGQGVQARALAEGLRSEGYEVEFIPINPPFPPRVQWVRRYPYIRTLLNQLLYLPRLRALRSADVIHVFSASYWSFLLAPVPAILAAQLLGKPIVLNYHSGEADDHLAKWGVLVHPWLLMVDEIVVPSEYLQETFRHYGYQARVVRNVVDMSRFRYRDRLPLRPRFLSTRNFERHYRVDVTLEAFTLLKARFPEATLTLAGSGSEEPRLRRLAASYGDSVRFAGTVDPENVPALYDEADIFLNSSVIDNQPVSILEAFASGLPVVTTGTGDIAAMTLSGKAGCLVPQEEPAAMAGAVAGLLENPERAVQMARRAKEEANNYTWARVCKHWEAVYMRATE